MHAVLHSFVAFFSLTLPSFPSSRCQSWSLLPTGWASIVLCIAVLVGHLGIRTQMAIASWSNLELAVRVEDRRLCKFTITASQRLFYLGDSCFAPSYHHRTLHALSLPSIFIYDDERGPLFATSIAAEEPLGEEVGHGKRDRSAKGAPMAKGYLSGQSFSSSP
jgi:hypothetical protein